MSKRPKDWTPLKEGQSYCPKCNRDKDLGEFSARVHKNGQKDWCLQCKREKEAERRKKDPEKANARAKAYYAANRDRILERDRERNKLKSRERRAANPDKDRRNSLSSVYNMTWEEYQDLLESQGNKCACCGVDFKTLKKSPCVDHDHACCPGRKSCGKCIRGLLCHPCNVRLGIIETGNHQHLFAYLEGRKDQTCQDTSTLP